MCSEKVDYGWVQSHMSNFVVSGLRFAGLFSPKRCKFSDIEYLDAVQRYTRSKSEVVQNHPEFCTFWRQIFVGGGPPNFETRIIKLNIFPITWQSFTSIADGSRRSREEKKKRNISSKT